MEVIHYEKPLYCKEGTCLFCFKFNTLCTEFEPDLVEDWDDANNNPILCQECDDLCWIHERPVRGTPHTACCCGLFERVENNIEGQASAIQASAIQATAIQASTSEVATSEASTSQASDDQLITEQNISYQLTG